MKYTEKVSRKIWLQEDRTKPDCSNFLVSVPLNFFSRMSQKKCDDAIERVKVEMLDRAQKMHTIEGDGIARLWIQAMAHELRKEFGLLEH